MQPFTVIMALAGLGPIAQATIFGIRIVDAPSRPQYQPPSNSYGPQSPNILQGVSDLKAAGLRGGAQALRLKVVLLDNANTDLV
jgi:hypothetical protein